MEPERVPYSPIIERPPLRWPGGARLALWIVPNIEFFEYMPPGPMGQRNPYPRCPHPDILNYASRDYGNRVGIWRLFEVFRQFDVRATLSLNLACYEHFPEILELCESRQYDVMCHGIYNTNYLYDMNEDQERAYIQDCVSTFRRLTGRDFTGWYTPAGSGTWSTPHLLAEAGVKYYVDIYHDDHPIPMHTQAGSILTMPYSMDLNDGWNFRLNIDGDEFEQGVKDQFDRLYEESESSGRMMSLPLHPNVMGQPHRLAHLERILDYVLARPGVWQASGADIAQWYAANYLPMFERHLADIAARPRGRGAPR